MVNVLTGAKDGSTERNVVFRDKSGFCLIMHGDRRRIRHHSGERPDIKFAIERHVLDTVAVMV